MRSSTDYSTFDGEAIERVHINVNANSIREGLIAKVGANGFAVIMCITSTLNRKNESYVSQRWLAKQTGVSVPTVNKTIKKLTKQGYISRELIQHGAKQTTTYTSVLTAIDETKEKPETQSKDDKEQPAESPKKTSAKDVINWFDTYYKWAFKVPYSPNWGRDSKLVKSKWLDVHDVDTIKAIIKTVFTNWDKWKSDKFPRPTIGMITGWLTNEALTIINAEAEKEKQLKEYEDTDLSKYFEKM